MQTFPLNYFSTLRTPTQVFAGRKLLSWPKIFLDICIFSFLDGHACDSFLCQSDPSDSIRTISICSFVDR